MKYTKKYRAASCAICGNVFTTTISYAKYCSKACQKATNVNFYTSGYAGVSTSTIGAISELRVSADLLAKGYEVFRSLSPTCSCDLAVRCNDRLLRIEVKTGTVHKFTGSRSTSRPGVMKQSRYDILVICYPDCIIYEPPLPETPQRHPSPTLPHPGGGSTT